LQSFVIFFSLFSSILDDWFRGCCRARQASNPVSVLPNPPAPLELNAPHWHATRTSLQLQQRQQQHRNKKGRANEKTRLQQHVTSAKAMRDGHVAMLDIHHPLLPPAFGQLAAAKQLHAHRP